MEIKNKSEIKVVGIPIDTTVHECISPENKLPKLWKEFMDRQPEIKNQVNSGVQLGVSFTKSKADCSFQYIAGVEVSEFEDVPEGMIQVIVPESSYAVYEHKGKLDTLGETYCKATEELKGKEKDYWFELYDDRYKTDSDDSIFEIWCAIEE